jgi:uncharacterized protein YdaU (DUF1376 family)
LLTLEEEGAYLRAVLSCWLHGSIPADPEKLARLIGKGASTTLATTVATMFEADGDRLVHPRLEEERKKQAQWREKSAAGGRKGAETRRKAANAKQPPSTVEPPLKGSLPNGTNQKATLRSSLSSGEREDQKATPEESPPLTTEEAAAILAPLCSRKRSTAGQRYAGEELIPSGGPTTP